MPFGGHTEALTGKVRPTLQGCVLPPSRSFAQCYPSSSTRLSSNVQTAAGVISLLNDYLISRRKPPLGFLSPLAGSGQLGFNDIASSSYPSCNTDEFSALGWHPVHPCLLVFDSADSGPHKSLA